MTDSSQCNVCNAGGGTEYELRLSMSEGGHRDVTLVLCDVCRNEHLATDIVDQRPIQPQS